MSASCAVLGTGHRVPAGRARLVHCHPGVGLAARLFRGPQAADLGCGVPVRSLRVHGEQSEAWLSKQEDAGSGRLRPLRQAGCLGPRPLGPPHPSGRPQVCLPGGRSVQPRRCPWSGTRVWAHAPEAAPRGSCPALRGTVTPQSLRSSQISRHSGKNLCHSSSLSRRARR